MTTNKTEFHFDNSIGDGLVVDSNGGLWGIKKITLVDTEHHLAALNLGASVEITTTSFVMLEEITGWWLNMTEEDKSVEHCRHRPAGVIELPVRNIVFNRAGKIIDIHFDELRWGGAYDVRDFEKGPVDGWHE